MIRRTLKISGGKNPGNIDMHLASRPMHLVVEQLTPAEAMV
jgi:hypothetical protein